MAYTPHLSFVRVRHLEKTSGSLFLADLDTQGNRGPLGKRPVYVPFGDVVDIPLADDVLFSFQRGSIRRFQELGYVEASILSTNDVVLAGGDLDALPGNDIILVSTSDGDVTITLPPIDAVPEGSSVLVVKSSPDVNSLIVVPEEGNLINDSGSGISSSKPFVAFALRSGGDNWLLISEHPVEGGGGGSPGPSYSFHQEERVIDAPTEGFTVQLASIPISNSEDIFVNGLRLSHSNYTISGKEVTLVADVKLFINDVVTVKYVSNT